MPQYIPNKTVETHSPKTMDYCLHTWVKIHLVDTYIHRSKYTKHIHTHRFPIKAHLGAMMMTLIYYRVISLMPQYILNKTVDLFIYITSQTNPPKNNGILHTYTGQNALDNRVDTYIHRSRYTYKTADSIIYTQVKTHSPKQWTTAYAQVQIHLTKQLVTALRTTQPLLPKVYNANFVHPVSKSWLKPDIWQYVYTGELGYDRLLYDGPLLMTDDMLGPRPMHTKYVSYVYDRFCI